jgi:hypothetical protein
MYLTILLNWTPLLALFLALYIAVVGVFALLFALCDACVLLSFSLFPVSLW